MCLSLKYQNKRCSTLIRQILSFLIEKCILIRKKGIQNKKKRYLTTIKVSNVGKKHSIKSVYNVIFCNK